MTLSSCGALDWASTYEALVRMRRVEEAHAMLWRDGLISGEFHSGAGEEAVAYGVVAQLRDGDAMALDHRGTPALVARGVDPGALLLEAVGSERGLCRGSGGHMHLVAPDVSSVTDGIVGSSGPTACGMALAVRHTHPEAVATAFFGEGAANQGMLLESLNLAVAWQLPVVFVCKDSRWAITTRSRAVTGGSLLRRARAFGMPARRVDGWKADAVAVAAGALIERARAGAGPAFLLARVQRPGGHFAGDPMLRLLREPLREAKAVAPGLLTAAGAQPGAPASVRVQAGRELASRFATLGWQHIRAEHDPVRYARKRLSAALAEEICDRVRRDVDGVVREVRAALCEAPVGTASVLGGGVR